MFVQEINIKQPHAYQKIKEYLKEVSTLKDCKDKFVTDTCILANTIKAKGCVLMIYVAFNS